MSIDIEKAKAAGGSPADLIEAKGQKSGDTNRQLQRALTPSKVDAELTRIQTWFDLPANQLAYLQHLKGENKKAERATLASLTQQLTYAFNLIQKQIEADHISEANEKERKAS